MTKSEQRRPMLQDSDWEPVSLVTGFAVAVVMLLVGWLSVAALTGGDGDKSPTAADPARTLADSPGGATSAGPTRQPAGSTRLERCAAAADDVERPLQLAGPALDQRDVHVGAMNKLVAGKITLQQATAFWNQTRVGAYHRIGQFKDAEARLQRQGVDCPAPRLLKQGTSELKA